MDSRHSIRQLEETWSRCKYLVLEKSAADYGLIRQLLKDKENPAVAEFHKVLEAALAKETTLGGFINAAQHVWGYFKKTATPEERARFVQALEALQRGETDYKAVKRMLYRLAVQHDQRYLLDSHYFDEIKDR